MSVQLPLASAYEKQHTYCAYCPKMCRFACPVSTAQSRETTTPWAKMTTLHHVARGHLGMSRSVAGTWYACTGCMRCRTHCTHQNDVTGALHAARGEAVRLGAAPSEAQTIVAKHGERSRRVSKAATQLFSDNPAATVAFVPGCTATVVAQSDALAGQRVCAEITGRPIAPVAAGCCGLPLLDAGDTQGFADAASAWLERLAIFEAAVFLDPGCLHALKDRAPKLGVRLPDTRLLHLAELADKHLDRLRPLESATAMRYHDPCRLGRGLGVYDEPRRVLGRILGRPVDEFHHHREDSTCSGAGGQLPRTDGPTSRAIAARRVEEHEWVGGGKIVSACPASTRQLRESANASVVSFVSLLSQCLPEA